MSAEHVEDRAAGLAALPPDDPERVAAYGHAAECEPCREALAEAEELMALLDEAPPPPGPSPEVLRRAMDAVLAEMGPGVPARVARERPRRARSALPALAAIAMSVLFVALDASGPGLAAKLGLHCLLVELVWGAVPAGLGAFYLRQRREPPVPAAIASLAAWGALGGQAYLHFRCGAAHETPHLVVFHLGGVLLSALLALVLGKKLHPAPA